MEQLYLKDPFKITNYNIRDESKMRKNFGGGFRERGEKKLIVILMNLRAKQLKKQETLSL